MSASYSKLLVIVNNVQKTKNQVIFEVFNSIQQDNVRFLIAARENELDKHKNEINRALKTITHVRLGFDVNDAQLFITKAINVSLKRDESQEETDYSKELYRYSKGDPFMFICGVMQFLSRDKRIFEDFIEIDIKKRIDSLQEKNDVWRAC